MGVNVEHKISDNFVVGGTFLRWRNDHLQKSSFGQESVNNTIFGFNSNFSTEVPFFTRLVNKLPNIDTDVPSNLSVRGEVAFETRYSKADQFEGESTIYVDDFEGSQSLLICVRHMLGPWHPHQTGMRFYYVSMPILMIWATVLKSQISLVFYRPHFCPKTLRVSNEDLSFNTTRRILVRNYTL
jgi:cell surface protein SprA